MKRLFWMGVILSMAALGAAQNFTLGGMAAIGANVSKSERMEKQDLKFQELFAGVFLDDNTMMQLRVGRIRPRGAGDTEINLDYSAFTISYLFTTPIGREGFFAGPAYYSGHLLYPNPLQPDLGPVREEVGKLGAMGGVEGFFPLSQTFNIYGQISGHYVPADERQFTFEVGLGLVIQF